LIAGNNSAIHHTFANIIFFKVARQKIKDLIYEHLLTI